jgi:hypothetical protein
MLLVALFAGAPKGVLLGWVMRGSSAEGTAAPSGLALPLPFVLASAWPLRRTVALPSSSSSALIFRRD